jgi:hypothetical protein
MGNTNYDDHCTTSVSLADCIVQAGSSSIHEALCKDENPEYTSLACQWPCHRMVPHHDASKGLLFGRPRGHSKNSKCFKMNSQGLTSLGANSCFTWNLYMSPLLSFFSAHALTFFILCLRASEIEKNSERTDMGHPVVQAELII